MLHSINNHDYYTYRSRLQDIITNVQLEYDIDLSQVVVFCSSVNGLIPPPPYHVVFIGEEGVDTGGLRQEFWRLFCAEIAEKYCIGDSFVKTFVQNVPALQVKKKEVTE